MRFFNLFSYIASEHPLQHVTPSAHLSVDGTRATQRLQGSRGVDGTQPLHPGAAPNTATGGHGTRSRAVPFYLALPFLLAIVRSRSAKCRHQQSAVGSQALDSALHFRRTSTLAFHANSRTKAPRIAPVTRKTPCPTHVAETGNQPPQKRFSHDQGGFPCLAFGLVQQGNHHGITPRIAGLCTQGAQPPTTVILLLLYKLREAETQTLQGLQRRSCA